MSRSSAVGVIDRPVLDYAEWETQLDTLSSLYQLAEPFPFIVLDNFLSEAALRDALHNFPSPDARNWTCYVHFNEKKVACSGRELIPSALLRIVDELNAERFVALLMRLTGVCPLVSDPSLEGAGLQMVKQGGFLNIHTDFSTHPRERNWERRVNLLIYLSEGWEPTYGGELGLWDSSATKCLRRIQPLLNRCVIFTTDAASWHGHPEPLKCPPEWSRKSISLYYYVPSGRPTVRATQYRARPTDSRSRAVLISLDTSAVRLFSVLKRRANIRNEYVGKVLGWVARLRLPCMRRDRAAQQR